MPLPASRTIPHRAVREAWAWRLLHFRRLRLSRGRSPVPVRDPRMRPSWRPSSSASKAFEAGRPALSCARPTVNLLYVNILRGAGAPHRLLHPPSGRLGTPLSWKLAPLFLRLNNEIPSCARGAHRQALLRSPPESEDDTMPADAGPSPTPPRPPRDASTSSSSRCFRRTVSASICGPFTPAYSRQAAAGTSSSRQRSADDNERSRCGPWECLIMRLPH